MTGRALRWAVRHAGRKRTVFACAAVSAADYLVPVLPNEGMAVVLGLLQPRKVVWIARALAVASACGAAALAAVLLGFADGAHTLGLQTFGDDWDQLVAYVQAYGPITLWLAAMFPSPPRAMVAATVLAGVPVAVVVVAVFAGKLVLYGLVFGGLARLAAWPNGLPQSPGWARQRMHRAMRRWRAFARWTRLVART